MPLLGTRTWLGWTLETMPSGLSVDCSAATGTSPVTGQGQVPGWDVSG